MSNRRLSTIEESAVKPVGGSLVGIGEHFLLHIREHLKGRSS
jgi:hypothetical protein